MNNYFMLIGRLTKGLELRYTTNNKAVCEVTLAVNNGKDDTSFVKVSLFGKIAETTAEYCKKGDLVATVGLIKNHNWEDKNGNKHYDYNFIASKISFLATATRTNEIKNNNKIKEEQDILKEVVNDKDPFEEFGNQVELTENDLPF